MARTKRIYNNPYLKAPRYNLDDGQPHIIHGIPFTRKSQICMGRCPQCRDPKKEPRAIRKQNGEELRLRLKEELKQCSTTESYWQTSDLPLVL